MIAYDGEGFKMLLEYGSWKIGMVTSNEHLEIAGEMKRHMLTDEAFALICGSAILYTDRETAHMKIGEVYNVPVGVWHQLIVNEGSKVLVIENRNTSKENTEKKYFNEKGWINAHE